MSGQATRFSEHGIASPVHQGKLRWSSDRDEAVPDRTALMTVYVPLVLLGVSAGLACPCYLASIGFFQEKFHSEYLFGAQASVVVLFHFIAVALQAWVDGSDVHSPQGCLFRLLAYGVLSAGALAMTPGCSNKAAVLTLGAWISMLGTWLFGVSARVGAAVGGSNFVSAGFALGSLVAVLLMEFTSFGPGATATAAYKFYGTSCGICALGPLLCVVSQCAGVRTEGSADIERIPELEPAESRPLLEAPLTVSAGADLETGVARTARPVGLPLLGALLASSNDSVPLEVSVGIFAVMASGFALVPTFSVVGAQVASLLFQMKCLGDFLGRVLGMCHASDCALLGRFSRRTRQSALIIVLCRAVMIVFIMGWMLRSERRSTPLWVVLLLVVVVFSAGGYLQLMLDLDAQLCVAEASRKHVMRLNMAVMLGGMVSGLVAGLVVVAHSHEPALWVNLLTSRPEPYSANTMIDALGTRGLLSPAEASS